MDTAAESLSATPAVEREPLRSRTLKLVLMLVGTLLVIAGQMLLGRTPIGHPTMAVRQIEAGVLLLAGALLFGWACRHLAPLNEATPAAENSEDATDTPPRRRWSLVVLSIFIAATAIDLFVLFGESPLVRLLWLAAILVLWLDPLLRTRWRRFPSRSGNALYLVGLLAVLVIAFITRTISLSTLPYDVDQDFAAEGLQARALATGEEANIFKFGDRQAPMFTYLPAAITMKFFGTGLTGLNASGVVEGLLIILGVYLLGTELFNRRVGLLAAALLVVSISHLSASRQSGYIDPVFYLTFASYFMIRGLRRQSDGFMVAAGVMTALSLQSYWSGRLIVPLFGLALLGLVLWKRQWLRLHISHLVVWLVAVLVTLGPMLVVFAREPLRDSGHPQTVSIFSPAVIQHLQQAYQVDTPAKVVLEQARRAALTFHYYPDTGAQFGLRRPLLDAATAFFFTLGTGLALFSLRQLGPGFLLAWILLGLFFGVFLATNPPQLGRTMIMLPPAALLAALSVEILFVLTRDVLRRISPGTGLFATGIVVLLLVNIGVQSWQNYVDMRGSYASPRTRVGRYLAAQPPSTRAYVVTTLVGWSEHDAEFRFLSPGILVDVITPEEFEAGVPDVGDPTLLIFMWDQAELAKTLPGRVPGGNLEAVQGAVPSEVAFHAYRLP